MVNSGNSSSPPNGAKLTRMSSACRRHPWIDATTSAAMLCAGLLLAGCAGAEAPAVEQASTKPEVAPEFDAGSAGTPSATSSVAGTVTPAASGSARATSPSGKPAVSRPAVPTAVSNALFPLKAGFQSVRQGYVTKGSRRLPHRRVFTVTDVSKRVDGVRTLLALDQDFDGGELAEQSIDLLALDKQGGVLYLGSYTETYEGGQFVNSTDAWLSGINGARWGTLVPGIPRVDSPSFTQAVVPGEGTATARVVKTGQKKCVPFRCFTDVVVVEEDGTELKYFAPGAGGILTQPLSGDPQETEELINVTSLSGPGLAEISAEALRLDTHARTVSPNVYGESDPARRAT
jgi:hypothetical protein